MKSILTEYSYVTYAEEGPVWLFSSCGIVWRGPT